MHVDVDYCLGPLSWAPSSAYNDAWPGIDLLPGIEGVSKVEGMVW